MLSGAAPSRFNALNENVLREFPPVGGLGGGLGALDAFPAGGLSSGGSWGGDGGVITASWAETRGACSQIVTMAAACSASADGWEAKSPLGGGSGFSGGVSSNLSTGSRYSAHLTVECLPSRMQKLDSLCLSYFFGLSNKFRS
jgi:hypothetical protein